MALNMRTSRSNPLCEMSMTSAAWALCSVLINQWCVSNTVSLNRRHTKAGLCWSVNEKVVTRDSQETKAGFLPGAVVECSLIQCWWEFIEHTTAMIRTDRRRFCLVVRINSGEKQKAAGEARKGGPIWVHRSLDFCTIYHAPQRPKVITRHVDTAGLDSVSSQGVD